MVTRKWEWSISRRDVPLESAETARAWIVLFLNINPNINKERNLPMTTKLYVAVVNQLAKLRSKRGQTLVEYGLILALVSIVVITVLSVLGTSIRGVFNTITQTLTNLPTSS